MQTLQLINIANEQSTTYKEKLETIKKTLPHTHPSPTSNAHKEHMISSQLPPEAVTFQVETNIDIVVLALESQKRALVKFFISGIICLGFITCFCFLDYV